MLKSDGAGKHSAQSKAGSGCDMAEGYGARVDFASPRD